MQNLPFKTIQKSHSIAYDAGAVNFRNSTNNSPASRHNCMLASVAYELRRRGYDVGARLPIDPVSGLAKNEGLGIKELTKIYSNAKINIGAKFKDLDSELINQGNGARGTILLQWVRNGKPRGGHAISYEVANNSVHIIDAQQGVTLPFTKYYKMKSGNMAPLVHYLRTDNLDINTSLIDYFVEEL